MDKIYENVYIGTFIYSLGVLIGLKNKNGNGLPWVSLNLFQQTPTDQYIGDLFGSLGGRNFIVEFKSSASMDKKEIEKRDVLLSRLDEEARFTSLKAHFFSGGHVAETGHAMMSFSPYILSGIEGEVFKMTDFACGVFDGFIEKDDVRHAVGCDSGEIKKYVDLLRELYEGEKRSSTGGLIANISNDGQITYVSTPNVFDLTLTLEQFNANLAEAREYNKPSPNYTMKGPGE